jgi:acetylornithine deacetylase
MDVIEVTKDLVSHNSASQLSNASVSKAAARWMRKAGMQVEFVEYLDPDGVLKVNVVGKKGIGKGGLSMMGHSDVVPAEGWQQDPFKLTARGGRLYGRGSADMKGSVACMLMAAAAFSRKELKRPVYVIVTADEEINCRGAVKVMEKSEVFRSSDIRYGIIGEPTLLDVVYAHKGSLKFEVEARGRAAHSSTGRGVNANHILIPFLNDVVELEKELKTRSAYLDPSFDPPHAALNIVLSDGGTASNITSPISKATINCRPMPGQNWDPIVKKIRGFAKDRGVKIHMPKPLKPLGTPTESRVVQEALRVTGKRKPKTVPYGTDGMAFGKTMELVVMGPGNIAQAHTVDEWITKEQLLKGVDVFTEMVKRFCVEDPE